MVLGKGSRKTIRDVSVCVSLTDIGIRKMSGVRKATVFNRFAAVCGRLRTVSFDLGRKKKCRTENIEKEKYRKLKCLNKKKCL